MSFGWYIGLHIPILVALCTGDTTLARSLQAHRIGPDEEMPSDVRSDTPGVWYPVLFFSLLMLTAYAYFGTAFSYPGFVGEEYRARVDREEAEAGGLRQLSRSGSASGSGRYTRVQSEEKERELSGSGDVRVDIDRPLVRRLLVDPNPLQLPHDVDATAGSPSGSTASAIPKSALGEAVEAAELSVGCAPPITQPLMRSLGIGRAQLHAEDQTGASPTPSSRDVEMGILPSNGNGSLSAPASAANAASADASPATSSGYCSICRLVKPARAKHCYKCRGCVSKFDHHCPFMANW